MIGAVAGISGTYGVNGVYGYYNSNYGQGSGGIDGSEGKDAVGKVSGTEECQTCKNRKYQDGSDENVSFKSAAHVSPEAAGSAVRAHEGEHVSNAYTSAAQKGGKVLQASVSIHTSICPECGKTYVSGGITNTKIKYPANPYEESRKALLQEASKGQNIDFAA